MSTDPRTALDSLIQAFEEHLGAAAARRGEGDTAVETAYLNLAEAFEAYEDALDTAYDEVTPLELYLDEEDDGDEDEDSDLEDLEPLEDED